MKQQQQDYQFCGLDTQHKTDKFLNPDWLIRRSAIRIVGWKMKKTVHLFRNTIQLVVIKVKYFEITDFWPLSSLCLSQPSTGARRPASGCFSSWSTDYFSASPRRSAHVLCPGPSRTGGTVQCRSRTKSTTSGRRNVSWDLNWHVR